MEIKERGKEYLGMDKVIKMLDDFFKPIELADKTKQEKKIVLVITPQEAIGESLEDGINEEAIECTGKILNNKYGKNFGYKKGASIKRFCGSGRDVITQICHSKFLCGECERREIINEDGTRQVYPKIEKNETSVAFVAVCVPDKLTTFQRKNLLDLLDKITQVKRVLNEQDPEEKIGDRIGVIIEHRIGKNRGFEYNHEEIRRLIDEKTIGRPHRTRLARRIY